MERTNVRYITADMFPERPTVGTIDVSFISLSLVLPALRQALEENGEYIAQEPYRDFKTSVIDSDLDGFCETLDISEGSIVKETLDNGDIRYRVLE